MFSAKTDSDLVECPYNNSHRMLRKRLQQHLLKCRLNYPDVEMQICPFNKTHHIPEPEFVHHVTNCTDRKLITQYKFSADDEESKVEHLVKHEPIECDENWDDTEVDDYNPQKYAATANILRQPHGVGPAQRKDFIKQERIRLGDYKSEDEEEDNRNRSRRLANIKIEEIFSKETEALLQAINYEVKRRTPSPPNIRNWQRDGDASSSSSGLLGRRVHSRDRRYRSPSLSPPPRHAYRPEHRDRSPIHRSPIRHTPPEVRKRRSPKPRSPARLSPARRSQSPDYALDEDPYYNGGQCTETFTRRATAPSTSHSRYRDDERHPLHYPPALSRERYPYY